MTWALWQQRSDVNPLLYYEGRRGIFWSLGTFQNAMFFQKSATTGEKSNFATKGNQWTTPNGDASHMQMATATHTHTFMRRLNIGQLFWIMFRWMSVAWISLCSIQQHTAALVARKTTETRTAAWRCLWGHDKLYVYNFLVPRELLVVTLCEYKKHADLTKYFNLQ